MSRNYDTTAIPAMSTGATDTAFLRQKNACYGIGPAPDLDDIAQGSRTATRSRIRESELHRFLRFNSEVAFGLNASK